MSVITQPITIFKGEDKTYTIRVVDDAGDPVDISGFTVEFEVKTAVGLADPASIAKAVGSGIVIAPDQVANKGEATLTIDPADTNTLTALIYKYDLIVIDGGGERQVVIAPSNFDLREVVNIAP